MALTASQLAQIKNKIGITNTAATDISDARLDVIYTEQNENLGLTMLEAAYERLGILSNEVDERGQIQDELRSQRYKHLMSIIERLEAQYGQRPGMAIGTGELDTGLDHETTLTDYLDLN